MDKAKRKLMTNLNKKLFIDKNKMLRTLSLLSLSFVMFIILIGCSTETEEVEGTVMDSGTENENLNQWFPAMWVNGDQFEYQPIYGTKTKKDVWNYNESSLFFTDLGIPFSIDSNEVLSISYSLSDDLGDLVDGGRIETSDTPVNQSYLFNIKPNSNIEFLIGETYYLEINVTLNGEICYYYSKLLYSKTEANNISVDLVSKQLHEEMKEQDISFLSEPRIWVDAKDDISSNVKAEYTGAKRLDEGFEYKDYIMIYEVDVVKNHVEFINGNNIDKQRYYYDSSLGAWNLGHMSEMGEVVAGSEANSSYEPYERYILKSNNGLFEGIYSNHELMLYDVDKEMIKAIYRLDSFDSDYIYDEYQQHKIKILDISDSGDIYFMVLGYINDDSQYSQRNGIAYYKYVDNKLELISFMEKQGTITQLEVYLDSYSYYNNSNKSVFFNDNQILYKLDLTSSVFSYVEVFLDAEFNIDAGILTWQGNQTKYNGSVFIIDLNKEKLKVVNLYQTGVYKQLLAVTDSNIIVGRYELIETYESLSGQIKYPFEQLEIYDFSGNIVSVYDYKTYGSEIYFGDVYKDEISNEWISDLIVRNIEINKNSKSSRIKFTSQNKSIPLGIVDQLTEGTNSSNPSDANVTSGTSGVENLGSVYEDMMIYVTLKNQDIIYIKKPKKDSSKSSDIRFQSRPREDVYKIVGKEGRLIYSRTLSEALSRGKELRDYKIFFSEYPNVEDKLIFDSTNLLTSQYLEEITIVPQRPELPRGCEVASLSVLLDYSLDVAPGKMELARNLRTSSMEYEIVDGFVNYVDMHVEFAGSMDDVNKPGLGVYIEPIKDLAKKYLIGTPSNVTGISFEQLLTLVSNKQPVLVIIPNRYQAVSDYSLEVWKTNSGYMEVTYQEHSVVIMGFDENYVYYSDPSKGIIDKKPKIAFNEAWESIGNQSLVIFD
jgi:uncharacterized protein YvpB